MYRSQALHAINKFSLIEPGLYVFSVSLLMYFLLWFINPDNKIIAIALLSLPLLYNIRLKDVRLSLLLGYVASIIIFTGKSYMIQLAPPGEFPLRLYPLGYVIPFIISPKHILAAAMVFLLWKDLTMSRFGRFRFCIADIALLLFYGWTLLSDLFVSKRPEVSLPFSLLALEGLIVYYYVRLNAYRVSSIVPLIIWLFSAIVLFESIISFQQYVNASPLGKNLESQTNIEDFGNAVDEIEFFFRPVGTFTHANYLGLHLTFFLSLIVSWMLRYRTSILFYAFLAGLPALAMTLSRSAWLGYGTSVLVILFIYEKIKKKNLNTLLNHRALVVAGIIVILAFYFVFPRAEKSLYSFGSGGGGGYFRALQIRDTLALIVQHPFFGVGTLMSVQESRALNPLGIFSTDPLSIHNWYLLLIVENGIPTFVFFSIFLLSSIRPTIQIVVHNEKDILFYSSVGILTGISSLLVIGLFQPYMAQSLLGISLAIMGNSYEKV